MIHSSSQKDQQDTQIKRLEEKNIKEEISKSRQGEDVTRYTRKDFKEKRIKEKS